MELLTNLLRTLPFGRVRHVNIGLHWTAVLVEVEGEQRCGLASTLHNDHQHGVPDVPQAGALEKQSALELANLVQEKSATMASVGMAAINALLPPNPETWVDLNAEEVIAEIGAGKEVVLVGHFPFVPRLEARVGKLSVLELNPRPGDLPVTAAEDVVPLASVLAITSMTLINQTLEPLLALRSPQACVILLGPSTPLSPVLYDYGFDILCGAVVTEIDPVLKAVRQGANFRQVHRAGVRLVSMTKNAEGLL
jgi:uncharacterized protein (DUF4213/DUF364 family)